MKVKMSDQYLNDQLNKAQQLLWGGSETENIEAQNGVAGGPWQLGRRENSCQYPCGWSLDLAALLA